MGMNPSAHFPPTSHRQIFFVFSKNLISAQPFCIGYKYVQ
jgi:hypothetical protein